MEAILLYMIAGLTVVWMVLVYTLFKLYWK